MSLSGLSCVDIDDCRENPLICLHGRCRNTVGSYICECESGYLHSSDGGKFSLHLAEIKNYWLFSESLIYWIQKCTLWFDEKNRALINFRLQLFSRTGSWVMRHFSRQTTTRQSAVGLHFESCYLHSFNLILKKHTFW